MQNKKTIIIFIAIIGITIFFRLWKLGSIPPGLYPDVAMNGTNAIQAIETNEYKIFYQDNNGREGLFMNLIAFSFKVFGVHMWSLRLVGSLVGMFTVIGVYFLTKEIIRRSSSPLLIQGKIHIAFLATFFTAISFWHVNFSRIGFRAILVPFVTVWSFYFLLQWWNNIESQNYNSKFKNIYGSIFIIFAGIFFGLGFHTYIAFRFVPFIVIILAFSQLGYLIRNKYYKHIIQWLIGYILFSIAAILVMLPLLLYFYQNPEDFMGRAAQVSIFEQPNPIYALGESLLKTVGMFHAYGDPNWRHNYSGNPLLSWPMGIFFATGIFLSFKQILSKKYQFLDRKYNLLLFAWFVLILAPSYLTAEGLPHALRSIGAIPPVMVWSGIGAWWLYEKIRASQILNISTRNIQILSFIILILMGFHEFKKYFYDWGKNPEVRGSFSQNLVDVGNFIRNLPQNTHVYVLVNEGGVLVEGVPVSAQTVKFIYAIEDKTTIKPKVNYVVPEKISEIQISNNADTIIIPEHYDENIFNELRAKFNNGIIVNVQEVTYFVIN